MSGFFLFFFKEKPRVTRLVMLQEGGLICMQPRLHQQILITVSKKPVCEEHTKRHISSAAESQVFYFPCAQMSVESFGLIRQLPGDQQEAVRAHTPHIGSVWTRAVENMTLLEMQNQPWQSIKTCGIWFFFFSTSLHV